MGAFPYSKLSFKLVFVGIDKEPNVRKPDSYLTGFYINIGT